jgi:hypothetical protein
MEGCAIARDPATGNRVTIALSPTGGLAYSFNGTPAECVSPELHGKPLNWIAMELLRRRLNALQASDGEEETLP